MTGKLKVIKMGIKISCPLNTNSSYPPVEKNVKSQQPNIRTIVKNSFYRFKNLSVTISQTLNVRSDIPVYI